jgi:L-lactate dehydrogenase
MKIGLVGVGKVGMAIAFAMVVKGIPDELILVGRRLDAAQGEAEDLKHACPFVRPMHIRAGEIADLAGCDVVIVAASIPPAPETQNADRLALATGNAALFAEIIPHVASIAAASILLIVTNPVDVMTHVAIRRSGFPPGRVIGSGTLLDTGRFRATLSDAWRINAQDIRGYIIGEHGDSQFAALSVASAGGVRLDAQDAVVRQAAAQARDVGYRIRSLKGHTNWAIGMAVAVICEAIVDDTRSVFPVSTLLQGQFGINDVCMSLPCVVGREGIARVLPVSLNDTEADALRQSAAALRRVIDQIGE